MGSEFNLLGFSLSLIICSVVMVITLVVTWKIFDKFLLKDWDFENAFTKERITNGGIFLASLILGVCYVVASAL